MKTGRGPLRRVGELLALAGLPLEAMPHRDTGGISTPLLTLPEGLDAAS